MQTFNEILLTSVVDPFWKETYQSPEAQQLVSRLYMSTGAVCVHPCIYTYACIISNVMISSFTAGCICPQVLFMYIHAYILMHASSRM